MRTLPLGVGGGPPRRLVAQRVGRALLAGGDALAGIDVEEPHVAHERAATRADRLHDLRRRHAFVHPHRQVALGRWVAGYRRLPSTFRHGEEKPPQIQLPEISAAAAARTL